MRRRVGLAAMLPVVAAASMLSAGPVRAQTVFLCEGDGQRSFVGAGGATAPGCREIADPVTELQLAPAEPDLAAMARQIASLSARVDRLEVLLTGTRSRVSPLAPAPRPTDTCDTRGRSRDLGQDIERRLDSLGR
jgi:hypothetical protein